jgi:hypothetical protein
VPTHRRAAKAGPGRPKGSRSRNKEAVRDICERLGCDPIAGLIHVAKQLHDAKRRTAAGQRLEAWCYAELAHYCYPKLKAVEHTGAVQVDLPLAIIPGAEPPA